MTQEVRRGNQTYYICDVCGFAYQEERWAQACEEFCTQRHSCSLEITQHAVELPEQSIND